MGEGEGKEQQFTPQPQRQETSEIRKQEQLSCATSLSPPHKLLLGIPIKIAIIEKYKAQGDSPPPPTIQRGLCGGESGLQATPHC